MKRVLIIEDDMDIAELERDYLQFNSYKAEIVQDGVLGLKKAMTNMYDVIAVNLMLPQKDRFEIIMI
ncbi:response regulator transcription factor [Pelosinus fermentans]|uniref:Response regulator receiver protein n=1 Tax=Pelosinus fermentans JBW45 TaxID=1192197 RepID=I9NL36_9FIRM|nr:response regulator transcription factor [Pelosinus fermentans]AJQ28986.1 response regulator receiver protein [Pelosinus fermentans JBW45]